MQQLIEFQGVEILGSKFFLWLRFLRQDIDNLLNFLQFKFLILVRIETWYMHKHSTQTLWVLLFIIIFEFIVI